nr:MAG TPA: hypothetical protein [Caudoviricetes sp.]
MDSLSSFRFFLLRSRFLQPLSRLEGLLLAVKVAFGLQVSFFRLVRSLRSQDHY